MSNKFNDNYNDVDWAMIDSNLDDSDLEDTVIESFLIGDKIKVDDGTVGYIKSIQSAGVYHIAGPLCYWNMYGVSADRLTLLEETKKKPRSIDTGSPVLICDRSARGRAMSKRSLGYVVETATSRGSQLVEPSVNVMFNDSQEITLCKHDLVLVKEITVAGPVSSDAYMQCIDNITDTIGTVLTNGDILQINVKGDAKKVYYKVVHNDNYKVLTEVYIHNGFN